MDEGEQEDANTNPRIKDGIDDSNKDNNEGMDIGELDLDLYLQTSWINALNLAGYREDEIRDTVNTDGKLKKHVTGLMNTLTFVSSASQTALIVFSNILLNTSLY